MKTKILLLLFVLLSLNIITTSAKQINKHEAKTVAYNILIKLKKTNEFTISKFNEIRSNNYIQAYTIDLLPTGYIVVCANTNLPPIIAYSFESNFGELNNNNPLYTIIVNDISKQNNFISKSSSNYSINNNIKWENIINANQQQKDTLFQQWPDLGNGWLKTNWTQDSPYNDFCPMDPVTNLRSIAGCPSVVIGQILNFHATTNNTYFDNFDDYYHNYSGRQYWIDNDFIARGFPSFPQLNIYLDTLSAHYLNNISPTNEDKAALTFACGIAATQVYTSSGSGTFGVNQAYEAYMRFNCTTASLLDTTNLDLFDRLMQNMKDTLPAHMAIVNPSWTSGHNVVVDGYNTDNYYHLNFGWGGNYNGWYLIPQEIPYSLTVIEGVIIDIMKNPTTQISEIKSSNSCIKAFPNPFSDSFKILYYLTNNTNVSIEVYDLTGKIIFSKQFSEKSGNHEMQINLDSSPEGIYFYKFTQDNCLYTGKLLKIAKK